MIIYQIRCVACNAVFKDRQPSNIGVLCTQCYQQGLFRKELVITGITRMGGGNICISGLDRQTGRFVRPVFESHGIPQEYAFETKDQIIRHFSIIEFEFTKYNPSDVYHTEDWIVNEHFSPRFKGTLKEEGIVRTLNNNAVNDLEKAMDFRNKSLFIVRVQKISKIWDEESYGKFKVRMDFTDASGKNFHRVPVSDLLTLAAVQYYIKQGIKNYSERFCKAFNMCQNKFIRIGLTRLFQGEYWKQVTAVMTIPDLFDGKSFSYFEKKL